MSATAAQLSAINANGNVLVAAGAGAGKTSTLVQRCVQRLLDPQYRAGVDEILMVTFTEAAAAEMRARVRKHLEERLTAATQLVVAPIGGEASNSENADRLKPGLQADDPTYIDHLQRQLALLDTAQIGTLHSFCFKLVREHFHGLEIDPQIRVLDEGEASVVKQEILDALFERYYSEHDSGSEPGTEPTMAEGVQELVQAYGDGREGPIRDLLLKVHEYTQTSVDPSAWFQRQGEFFSNPQPTEWREWLLAGLHEWRAAWAEPLASHPVISPAGQFGQALREVQDSDGLERFAAVFASLPDPGTVPTKHKQPKRFFDEARFLRSLLVPLNGTDPLEQDWGWTRGHMLTLLRLAQEFAQDYAATKREGATVDFHDLEQFTLRLLRDPNNGERTPIALEQQRRFRFVFIDECQDINAAQDAILHAISRDPGPLSVGAQAVPGEENGNRFLVGDVKQSIYRFRLADPTIFQEYESRWSDPAGAAQVIRLQENFRSREALLLAFNAVFSDLMLPQAGGVEFTKESKLGFGAPEARTHLSAQRDASPRVHVHLRLTSKDDAAEGGESNQVAELTGSEQEARIVANCLRELHDSGHLVWDEKLHLDRPATWGDMAVLLRAPGGKTDIYAREFARQGIPLQVAQTSFFEALEVADLLNLLSVLDNPLQDLPLIAVLHSPLAGLTEDELAEVRLAANVRQEGPSHVPFWTGLNRFHEIGPAARRPTAISASSKVGRFLARFQVWRRMGRDASLSQRLQTILTETHYLEWLAASAENPLASSQKLANVRRFLSLAEQFDPFQRQGLGRFLRFVDAQKSVAGREPLAGTGDAVQLISIHRSKGLEYPIVALPDLGKRFNFSDLTANIVLNGRYGLCPKVKPPHTRRRYPSLPHWLAGRSERADLLGEEIRLLYVGMTRARDTLLLIGSIARSTAENWSEKRGTATELLEASSMLAWLGPWLDKNAAAPFVVPPSGGLDDDRLKAGLQTSWLDQHNGTAQLFSWTIHTGSTAAPSTAQAASITHPAEAAPEVEEQLTSACQRVAHTYPFLTATQEAAKTSVSLLRRKMRELEEEARPWRPPRIEPRREHDGLSAAEIGTAHHTLIEFSELGALASEEGVRAESARLVASGSLTAEEAAAIDTAALVAFWSGDIGQKIIREQQHVFREMPFTARFGAAELREFGLALGEAPPDEFTVVQGVVDLAVILPDEIWLLDFKTDDVAPAKISDKVNEYRPQIVAYAAALRRIYDRPVTERWLHFLSSAQTVSI